MAGPHLTGVIALMLSADPDLLPWDARDILETTSTDILAPGYDFQSGHGLVNAFEAVKEVMTRKESQVATEDDPSWPDSQLVLHPSYPNPFYTEATFRFTVREPAFVTLKSYDLLGREVATPVAAWHSAGTHEIMFSAEDLPAGHYAYRLETNESVLTNFMTRIRR